MNYLFRIIASITLIVSAAYVFNWLYDEVTDTGSGNSSQRAQMQTNPGPAIDPGYAQVPQTPPQTQTIYVQQPAENHFWQDMWMYHMLFGSPSTTTVVHQYAPAPANVQAPPQSAFAPAPAYAQQPQNAINNVTNNITQAAPQTTNAAPVTKSPNYGTSNYAAAGYDPTSMKASTTTYKAAPAAATASVTPSYTTPRATSYSGSYSASPGSSSGSTGSSSSSRSSYSSPSYSSYSSRSSYSSSSFSSRSSSLGGRR